jgi:hypothetical protein
MIRRRIMTERRTRMMPCSANSPGASGHPWHGQSNLCRLRSFGETSAVPWTQQIPAPDYQPCLQESWEAPQTESDGPPTGPESQLTDNSNREPDSKSIGIREKFLYQLQFLKFSGDRDTKPSTVDWFFQLVAEYVRLGGGVGVSQDDRLNNTALENLSREPRGGKYRAYRSVISWIGSRSGLSIYMGGSYAWVINYGTGKNVNTPPSTVPIHQHYPFSWIEFVDAFTDEFDPERRQINRFRGAESNWRAEESARFNSGARDSSRFHKEAFDRRGKDSRRGKSRSEQSKDALQAQQR